MIYIGLCEYTSFLEDTQRGSNHNIWVNIDQPLWATLIYSDFDRYGLTKYFWYCVEISTYDDWGGGPSKEHFGEFPGLIFGQSISSVLSLNFLSLR